MSGERVATFLERVSERHFPWWYTEFGVVCSCSRSCPRGGEECAVMLRAIRWAATPAPVPSEVAETTAGEREARQVVISPVEWADLLAEAWRKGHRLHEPVIEFGETPCDCPNPYGGSSA